jgi:hypothetical protein
MQFLKENELKIQLVCIVTYWQLFTHPSTYSDSAWLVVLYLSIGLSIFIDGFDTTEEAPPDELNLRMYTKGAARCCFVSWGLMCVYVAVVAVVQWRGLQSPKQIWILTTTVPYMVSMITYQVFKWKLLNRVLYHELFEASTVSLSSSPVQTAAP